MPIAVELPKPVAEPERMGQPPTAEELLEVFQLRYGPPQAAGWAPRRRHRFGYYRPDEYYEALLNRLVTPGCHWLEIGGGSSMCPCNPKLAEVLARRCGLLVGIDPSDNLHANPYLHERAQCLAEEYQGAHEFDLATLRMVAEHITEPKPVIQNLHRLLRPRGKVLLLTVNRHSPISIAARLTPFWLHHPIKKLFWGGEEKDTFPVVYRMNTRTQLRTLFEQGGFKERHFAYLDDCSAFGLLYWPNLVELSVWRAFHAVRVPYVETCLLGVYEKVSPMTLSMPSVQEPSTNAATSPPPAAPGPAEPDRAVTVIERSTGWKAVNVRELWNYRELLFFLTLRDIKVRYRQTVLGVAWAVLQPIATMIIFTIFFGRMAQVSSGGINYSLFALCGLLPWFFFSNSMTSSANSVVGSQNLVTKIYFPRLIIPLGSMGPFLVDFAIAFGLLLVMMPFFGAAPGWRFAFIPLILFFLMVGALGMGTLLSALTVAYRDFRHVVPFVVQMWMFATPSIYMETPLTGGSRASWFLPVNPTYGLVANFRAAVLGRELDPYSLTVSACVCVVMLVVGCFYFRRVERTFADVI